MCWYMYECHMFILLILSKVQTRILSLNAMCNDTNKIDQYVVTSDCEYCACNKSKIIVRSCLQVCSTLQIPLVCYKNEDTVITYQKRMYDTNCTCSFSLCAVPEVTNLQVGYGQSVSLNCSAQPFWNFNRIAIFLRKDKYLAEDSNLKIYNMTPADTGIYSCGTKEMYFVAVKDKPVQLHDKGKTKIRLKTIHVIIISIFGLPFAIALVALEVAFIRRKLHFKPYRTGNNNAVNSEMDLSLISTAEPIYEYINEINEEGEIFPRSMHTYEYPDITDLHDISGYQKPDTSLLSEGI